MFESVKQFFIQHRILVGVAAIAFFLGFSVVSAMYWRLHDEHKSLKTSFEVLNEQHKASVQSLAKAEVEIKVLNNGDVLNKQAIESLRLNIVELETELNFYRNLMVGQSDKKGLDLHSFLATSLAPGKYQIQLTFVQYAKKHRLLSAKLEFLVKGRLNQQDVELELSGLLDEKSALEKLRFKYFQELSAIVTFPEGFEPRELVVNAVIGGKKPKKWQQVVTWNQEEL